MAGFVPVTPTIHLPVFPRGSSYWVTLSTFAFRRVFTLDLLPTFTGLASVTPAISHPSDRNQLGSDLTLTISGIAPTFPLITGLLITGNFQLIATLA